MTRSDGPFVKALTVYPLKSAAGIDVETLELDAWGAAGDRHWLLIDPAGRALTAREHHRLLTIVPRLDDARRDGPLTLTAPGCSPVVVPVPDVDAPLASVQIWNDAVTAREASADASGWCSDVLETTCRLVRVTVDTRRPLAARFAGPLAHEGRHVTFTDGAPLLMLGLPSISHLNERLVEQGETALMERQRFRANVWLDGLPPHEEDTWHAVRIGDVRVGVGSACLRCVLTTVDPGTLERGVEPLRTLARYRRADGGVVFGMNATHAGPGRLAVGDTVTVVERR